MKSAKLDILICENSFPEYKFAAEMENFKDINLVPFPDLCSGKMKIEEVNTLLSEITDKNNGKAVLCSRFCGILKADIIKSGDTNTCISEYCNSYTVNIPVYNLCLEKGYYIISTGWLERWEARIAKMGFSRESAAEYFKEWCTLLVYFDTGIYPEAHEKLEELSDWLKIRFMVVQADLEHVRSQLKSIVYEWRLREIEKSSPSSLEIKNLQQQTAVYAAAMEIMKKIAAAEYKRDVIEELKLTMILLFGANKTVFWNMNERLSELPDYIMSFSKTGQSPIHVPEGKDFFLAKIISAKKITGIIEVGDFLFPENISKYNQLFLSVIQIAELAISNAERYEDLQKARNDFEFVSYHDSMTGLYNRNYFNGLSNEKKITHPAAVFCFDIDNLKTVNDTLGHQDGDKLIISASDAIRKSFRETDIPIRMGGDEFIVIANNADSEIAASLSIRLKNIIKEHNEKTDLKLSVSEGIAVSDSFDINLDDLINKADKAMYKSKNSRKNSNIVN